MAAIAANGKSIFAISGLSSAMALIISSETTLHAPRHLRFVKQHGILTDMSTTHSASSLPVTEILGPGQIAPDFTLAAGPNKQVRLADFRGKPVVLVFYPADWSPVCGDQLAFYNEITDEFDRYGAKVLAISVDGPWCHEAFATQRKLDITLLSDFEPKGAVARKYGVYRDKDGLTERALFVIDGKGVIRWSYVSPITINPGADGILAALAEIANCQLPIAD